MADSFRLSFLFIVKTLFDLYLYAVLLRFILQLLRVSFANPIAQFTYRVTEPVLKNVRHFIPRTKAFDLPLTLYFFLLISIKWILLNWFKYSSFIGIPALLQLLFMDTGSFVINFYFYAIFLVVLLSWLGPQMHTPVTAILHRVTEPFLQVFRRVIPPIASFDLSPLFALISLKVLEIIFVGGVVNLF